VLVMLELLEDCDFTFEQESADLVFDHPMSMTWIATFLPLKS